MMLIRCWLSLPLWGSVLVPCFVDHCFVYFLVLQTSCSGRESWLLYFFLSSWCLITVLFCGSSSQCRGSVRSVCLRYFLIDHTHLLFQKEVCFRELHVPMQGKTMLVINDSSMCLPKCKRVHVTSGSQTRSQWPLKVCWKFNCNVVNIIILVSILQSVSLTQHVRNTSI